MGSDLFGSFAEATCAALVVSGTSSQLIYDASFLFPLILSACGILICIFTSLFATVICSNVDQQGKIESTLKRQLNLSTILLTPVIILISLYVLPDRIEFIVGSTKRIKYTSSKEGVMACALLGLWSGLIIGYLTDYFTSASHSPVEKLAESCRSGAAINIIHGLALGYLSTIIPIICLASTFIV